MSDNLFGFKGVPDDPPMGPDGNPLPVLKIEMVDETPMLAVPKDAKFVTHYEVRDTGQRFDAVFENLHCTIENEYNPSLDNAPD